MMKFMSLGRSLVGVFGAWHLEGYVHNMISWRREVLDDGTGIYT
jgi:hypothetical protein